MLKLPDGLYMANSSATTLGANRTVDLTGTDTPPPATECRDGLLHRRSCGPVFETDTEHRIATSEPPNLIWSSREMWFCEPVMMLPKCIGLP
jgi:hypothetical protein